MREPIERRLRPNGMRRLWAILLVSVVPTILAEPSHAEVGEPSWPSGSFRRAMLGLARPLPWPGWISRRTATVRIVRAQSPNYPPLPGSSTPLGLTNTAESTVPPPVLAGRPDVGQPTAVSSRPYLSDFVTDPPIQYLGPPPSQIDDIDSRDGPRIPEPMVFDLVRGLGARRGELEFNVLNLVPTGGKKKGTYEWAPEVEYAVADGLALEFELPIFNTTPEFLKFAAQYTFGTALDDAFIHGVQGLLQYDLHSYRWSPTALYLAGIRLNKTWSLFGMFGFNYGELIFPFDDVPPRQGVDIITNFSIFADVTEHLVVGVETNLARRLLGSGDFLLMPQIHWEMNEHTKIQFGYGVRDNGLETYGEVGFRVIFER